MTGFGAATADAEGCRFSVEIKSVNNRFFKATVRVPEEMSTLETELEETKTLLAAAQDRNTGLEAQISEYRRKEESRQKSQMRQGIQGTILAVNQAWNFVVLSIGDRQGVVSNAEMLVQRGGQLIGKVRVTSVEPSTSIADIIVRTVPRGFSVMPGDTVIYPSQKN